MSLRQSADVHDELLALDNQLCFALYAAARTVTRAYSERLQEFSLTYPQYLVMLVLWEWERKSPERPTVTALGDRLDLDSGTLTPLLRRLAAKGLITRRRGDEDERELCVRLTPEGRALKQPVASVPTSLLSRSPLPLEEIIDLRERLKRLRDGVAA